MFVFFFETGCRCGEALGLTWSDVDLEKRFVKIDHQLLYEVDETGVHRHMITEPKPRKSIRKIPLSSKAVQALEQQWEQMEQAGLLKNHTIDGYSDFVFLKETGNMLSSHALDLLIHRVVYICNAEITAQAIKDDREPELMPNITAHILRHTACTRMAEQGMDQRTLQEIMGHQNLALTMRVYNHVDEKRMRDEMDRIDRNRNRDKASKIKAS